MPDAAVSSGLPNVVPIFPLPEHVLLPASPTPYRVFEPCYQHMVRDLLALPAGERWLAIPRLIGAGNSASGDSPIHPIAAMAKLTLVSPLADGEYLIIVEGLFPCRLEEVDSSGRPYRLATIHPLLDSRERALAPQRTVSLIQAAFTLFDVLGASAAELPLASGGDLDDSSVVYRIANTVVSDADLRQAILDERCPDARCDLVFNEISDLICTVSRSPYPQESQGMLG